jgi:cell wall assembly regulator SMI1
MDPVQALADAVTGRDAAAVCALLADGLDPAAPHPEFDDYPVVLDAASSGAVELVRPFLDAGLPVDTEDDHGTTPLICAIQEGRLSLTEFLIGRGADTNHSQRGDIEPGTPLTLAMELDDPTPFVSLLLAAGANPDLARPDGWTPLMLAASFGHTEVLHLLLQAGADVRAARHGGEVNALSVARDHGRDEMVRLLLERGAVEPVDPNVAHRARSVADIAAWLAAHPRPPAGAVFVPRTDEQAEVDACAVRLAAMVDDIAGWLAANATVAARRLEAARGGADPGVVAELEAKLGERLPVDVQAYLRLFGGDSGLDVFEYSGLGAQAMLATWASRETMRDEGVYGDAVPVHIEPDDGLVRFSYCHPGWLPLNEDGAGNLHCIDLAPADNGVHGQIIAWEMQGGPCNPRAPSLEDYLRNYRDALVSNRYRYDEDSGTYLDC